MKFLILALFAAVALGEELQRICTPLPKYAMLKLICAPWIHGNSCSAKSGGRCRMESVSQDREANLARLLNKLLEEELSDGRRWNKFMRNLKNNGKQPNDCKYC